MIHEIDPVDRIPLLEEVQKYTDKLIILDYTAIIPMNLWGIGIRLIEFFAGRLHYKNFKAYIEDGGLTPLLQQTGYIIKSERINRMGVIRMVIAETQI